MPRDLMTGPVHHLTLQLIVVDRHLAARLIGNPATAARCRVQLQPRVGAVIQLARALDWDAVVIAAGGRHARWTAVVARAIGICVWWVDEEGRRCPGWGSPAHSSKDVNERDLERVAELAANPGAGHEDGPRVSVVVTTLDENTSLDRLIPRVTEQLSTGDELVVVDGGSADGSIDRALARWRQDTRVRLEVRPGLGISAGRNAGVNLASNEVILCTDAGCDPDPGWVEGMRRAFAGSDPPGLASGPYVPVGRGALAKAQAAACYPAPGEVARPDLASRLYTKVFGTGFHPEFAVGRNVAFTREAWAAAGGFPEHLPTGEDVSFGLAVAQRHRCVGTSRARVSWRQRDDLAATWRMYRSYGRASTDGGNRRLLLRDGVRGAGYLAGALASLTPAGRRLVVVGAALYLSLPVRRAHRSQVPLASYPLLPVALAVKDLGKLVGAFEGLRRSRRKSR